MITPFIISAIASVALLSNSVTALALPEAAKALEIRATSGISVEAACNIFYGTSYSAIATGSGCYDWVCARGNDRFGLDLNEWCQGAHGGQSYASCSNGVYSWVCNYCSSRLGLLHPSEWNLPLSRVKI
jgi:hypothetical protein